MVANRMNKKTLLSIVVILWAFQSTASEACLNYWMKPVELTTRFNYSYFVKQKADYIKEIESGKIESEFKSPEDKIAFIEALAVVYMNKRGAAWTLPESIKLQDKMIKYVEMLDIKKITMYQVNKFLAFAFRERLALFYPVRQWGKKPLSEVTDEQVVARIEQESLNSGVLRALVNLGFIGDPVGFKRFMTFVNRNEAKFELSLSAAINSALFAAQGITWMTPVALKLPQMNLFRIDKKFSTSPYTSLFQREVPDEQKTTLKEMYLNGTLKARREDGSRQLPPSAYWTQYYSVVNAIQLPLFFAALWGSIGLNMYDNLGGPNHNGVVDVVTIEIVKTRDQTVKVFKMILPSKPGDSNETH